MSEMPKSNQPARQITALDLGTNSFHAVIMDIYPDGSFRCIDKLKEMVVLANRGLDHSHYQNVQNLNIDIGSDEIILSITIEARSRA